MVPAEGFEPPTFGLQNRCTTTVLSRHFKKIVGIIYQIARGKIKPFICLFVFLLHFLCHFSDFPFFECLKREARGSERFCWPAFFDKIYKRVSFTLSSQITDIRFGRAAGRKHTL